MQNFKQYSSNLNSMMFIKVNQSLRIHLDPCASYNLVFLQNLNLNKFSLLNGKQSLSFKTELYRYLESVEIFNSSNGKDSKNNNIEAHIFFLNIRQ